MTWCSRPSSCSGQSWKAAGQTVETELAPHLPQAPIDPAQMKQVLVNLIRNSIQAMSRGGVLALKTGVAGEEVWVSISDTGGGIPHEQLNRIFKPFYTTKKKGSGLGLDDRAADRAGARRAD